MFNASQDNDICTYVNIRSTAQSHCCIFCEQMALFNQVSYIDALTSNAYVSTYVRSKYVLEFDSSARFGLCTYIRTYMQ